MGPFLREGDGLVVLDFKTDKLERSDLNPRIEHYQTQAKVYSDAIRTIFGKPPKEVILFFLHIMEPVSVR
jgi:ATP-dependent exoDNAse (exonuclease V) beta subunit